MKYCYNCGSTLSLGTEKFCPSCGQNLGQHPQESNVNPSNSVSITDTKGNVIGVGFRGSGNVIGEQVVVGSGTINVSKQQLTNVNFEYANALKQFSESLNQKIEGKQVPEEQVEKINQSINELAQESQDLKPGQTIGEIKKSDIKSKLFRIAKNVLKVLPNAV